MLNRRKFVAGTTVALAVRPTWSSAALMRQSVWLGSCPRGGVDNGIYHCWFDPTKGVLSEPVLAAPTDVPSFLCTMRDIKGRLILYCVNEVPRREGSVTSFLVDEKAGTLTPLNKLDVNGVGPTYVSAQPSTRTLYTANYTGSSLSVLRVKPDGQVTEVLQRFDTKEARFGTPGTHPEQGVSHPHSVTLSPDKRFVLVNDLGDDSIDIFAIESDGRLSEKPVLVKVPPTSGPRHLAFHPNGRWVYGLNELGCTLRQYAWREHNGVADLQYLDRSISTVDPARPPPAGVHISAAEVEISPDGLFLYVSMRGVNSLAAFAIASRDGALTFKQSIACGGKGPRHFKLAPTAGWIVCCNNNSPDVTLFRRNKTDGALTGPVQTVKIESSEFVLFT